MKEYQDVEEQLKLKKIKELLNTKKITVYLYHKIKSQKTDHDRRRLMELSILMPHEFIKALYLSII